MTRRKTPQPTPPRKSGNITIEDLVKLVNERGIRPSATQQVDDYISDWSSLLTSDEAKKRCSTELISEISDIVNKLREARTSGNIDEAIVFAIELGEYRFYPGAVRADDSYRSAMKINTDANRDRSDNADRRVIEVFQVFRDNAAKAPARGNWSTSQFVDLAIKRCDQIRNSRRSKNRLRALLIANRLK